MDFDLDPETRAKVLQARRDMLEARRKYLEMMMPLWDRRMPDVVYDDTYKFGLSGSTRDEASECEQAPRDELTPATASRRKSLLLCVHPDKNLDRRQEALTLTIVVLNLDEPTLTRLFELIGSEPLEFDVVSRAVEAVTTKLTDASKASEIDKLERTVKQLERSVAYVYFNNPELRSMFITREEYAKKAADQQERYVERLKLEIEIAQNERKILENYLSLRATKSTV